MVKFKTILVSLFLLTVGAVVVPVFAQTTFNPEALENLTLPQPADVVIDNMHQVTIIYEPPANPSGGFGQLLQQSVGQITSQVLGAKSDSTIIESVSPRTTKKDHYTIALIGDSMVDTMGTNTPALEKQLASIYPKTTFLLLNYGIGSTNIDSGPERLTKEFHYQNRNYPAPVDAQLDLAIIESFAYNPLPLSEGNLQNHTSKLTTMVNLLKKSGVSSIFLLATIAPHHKLFGTGPAGVNWEEAGISSHTESIHAYLENTINVGKALGIPVIDAFHASQDGQGNGRLELINPGDHIHPSGTGFDFVASTIAGKLVSTRTLE